MNSYINLVRKLVHLLRGLVGHTVAVTLGTILSEPLAWVRTIMQYKTRPEKMHKKYGINPTEISIEGGGPLAVYLLVHGFLHNSNAWLDLARVLHKEAITPVYTIDISYEKEIDLGKGAIEERISEIKKFFPNHDVSFVLIGHSRGAQLVTRIAIGSPISDYFQEGFWRDDIKKVIRIGNSLNEEEIDHLGPDILKRVYDIEGTKDAIIPPVTTSKPHHLFSAPCGHLGLLYSQEVHAAIVRIIRDDKF